jgi:hypothetical protein
MARPGLEPGHHDFQGVAEGGSCLVEGLQIGAFNVAPSRRGALGLGRLPAALGLHGGLGVPNVPSGSRRAVCASWSLATVWEVASAATARRAAARGAARPRLPAAKVADRASGHEVSDPATHAVDGVVVVGPRWQNAVAVAG